MVDFIYLNPTVDKKKVDFFSNRCQIRDILGTNKCKRRADTRFTSLDEKTKDFEGIPICNNHLHQLRNHEEVTQTRDYVITRADKL